MASIRSRAFHTNRALEPLREGWLQSFLSNFPLITAHVECFIKRHTATATNDDDILNTGNFVKDFNSRYSLFRFNTSDIRTKIILLQSINL